MKIAKFFAALACVGCTLYIACSFKQKAEAKIKGEGGDLILNVEVISGAEFKTSGRFPKDKPLVVPPPVVTVAICNVLARVTRKERNKDGEEMEVIRFERHTFDYQVPCVPGAEWEVDCSDPVVLQIPQDWYIKRATFAGKSQRGDLIVSTTTPAADARGTLYQAEPGHKVLAVGFPYGTPEDVYEVEISFGSLRPGPARIKAIFAGAARVIDPATGQVTTFYPPASLAAPDFRLVKDPFYIADVFSTPILTHQLDAITVASLNLPRSAERVYFALATPGANIAAVDTKELFLRKE